MKGATPTGVAEDRPLSRSSAVLMALLPPAGALAAAVLLVVLCRARTLAAGSLGTGCGPNQFLYHLGCWGMLLAGLITLATIGCSATLVAAGLGKRWAAPAAMALAAIPWWVGALAALAGAGQSRPLEELFIRLSMLARGALGREVGAWFGAGLLIAVALGLGVALAAGCGRERRPLVATCAAVALGLGVAAVLASLEAGAVIVLVGTIQEFGAGANDLPAAIARLAAAGTARTAGIALSVVALVGLGAWTVRTRGARAVAVPLVVLLAVVGLTLGLDALAGRPAQRAVGEVEALRSSAPAAMDSEAHSPPTGPRPPG